MARTSAVCLVLLAVLAVGEADGWGHYHKSVNSNKDCPSVKMNCPSSCPNSCKVDCETCKCVCHCDKPGRVCQDPRFVGGDGITFYFHGRWNRDFTWVQSVGILFDDRQLYIGAMKTGVWDDSNDRVSLVVNGEPILLLQLAGAVWQSDSSPQITIARTPDTNAVDVEVERSFKITAVAVPIMQKESMIYNYGITEEDCFAHLNMSFKLYYVTTRSDIANTIEIFADFTSLDNFSNYMSYYKYFTVLYFTNI